MKAIGVKSVHDFPTKQGMVLTMVVEDVEAMAHLVVLEVVQVVVEVDLWEELLMEEEMWELVKVISFELFFRTYANGKN